MELSENAIKFVKEHKKEIIDKFANLQKFPPVIKPFTIFLAGSPGAGKTEFSNSFEPRLYKYECEVPIVRIDADEIRKLMPGYDGTNSSVFQSAVTIGMHRIFNFINDHDQNAILDTTFSNFKNAEDDIKISLKHKRKVGIFYIYLEPKVAWDYTKIREKKEGRIVSKEFFINAYFNSRITVNKIKSQYPDVELNLIKKKLTGKQDNPIAMTTQFNISNVDNYLKERYNRQDLLTLL